MRASDPKKIAEASVATTCAERRSHGSSSEQAQVVDAVAELVKHRVRRLLVRDDVREHPDVAVTVDVDAEGVLALATAWIQVAAAEDSRHIELDSVERPARELHDVTALEQRVEVDRTVRRELLEERIRVVPRTKLRDGAAEAGGQALVESSLPARERLGRRSLRLLQRLEQLPLVELVDREREREPVPVAEPTSRFVAQAGELAHVVGDLGADRLRRLPRLAALGGVVALAEDALDLGVVDLDAADDAAMTREARLDGGFELDDLRAQAPPAAAGEA